MENTLVQEYLEKLISQIPEDWIKLTTHRLDIYKEELAKTEFIDEFDKLFQKGDSNWASLESLPTAYDYIRLGHPLSSVLEWALAKEFTLRSDQVICFSSQTMPVLALLRTNHFKGRKTLILKSEEAHLNLDEKTLKEVYGYDFELKSHEAGQPVPEFEGSIIMVHNGLSRLNDKVDFELALYPGLGSLIIVKGPEQVEYVGAIQHVRRRESIAMTPANCLKVLEHIVLGKSLSAEAVTEKAELRKTIASITGSKTNALIASSGLSIQYAIMMGLIDDAMQRNPGKEIKIIVPPNCYGGTNDQARRVAAALDYVDILDLPVDGDNDMVNSTDQVLEQCASLDAVPLIIAEIPTNPRVEVPNLDALRAVLSAKRQTPSGAMAIDPVFILDQTFCPNVQFLKEEGILASIRTISYVSGSKFPSGGKCTAGYCVANKSAADLMPMINKHLQLCDNEATALQVEILTEQMPSMNERIAKAYRNTREFVNFIEATLPEVKINFVSEELAQADFTPSVFSLDLPTKGDSHEEREAYKRELNQRLIDMMISEIPGESKYCVSYGQLKGCYWTIPATSTQGTTKEADKDYIARVSVSPNLDLERHKEVFAKFVASL